MILNHPMLRAQIAQAFRRMGGKVFDIIRTPCDPNGQPTGEPEKVGEVYGVSYIDTAYRDSIHIDLPGVVSSGNNLPTVTAIPICKEAPREKDTLRCCGKQTKVLSVAPSGPVYTMTTEELI